MALLFCGPKSFQPFYLPALCILTLLPDPACLMGETGERDRGCYGGTSLVRTPMVYRHSGNDIMRPVASSSMKGPSLPEPSASPTTGHSSFCYLKFGWWSIPIPG